MAKVEMENRSGIVIIWLDNGKFNVIDTDVARGLTKAIKAAKDADGIIIRGKTGDLSAGADIKMMLRNVVNGDIHSIDEFFEALVELERTILRTKTPILAVVDGVAAGGGLGICLLADSVISTKRSVFRVGTSAIALPPAMGMGLSLPFRIGKRVYQRFISDNPKITASEAKKLGMVNEVVSEGELEETIDECIVKIHEQGGGWCSLREEIVPSTDIDVHLTGEEKALKKAARKKDFGAALQGFLDKRSIARRAKKERLITEGRPIVHPPKKRTMKIVEHHPDTRIGIALSGGGAKGFAHIGVLEVLMEYEVPIHLVGGASMGSIIAAAYCSGMPVEQMTELATSGLWNNLVEFHVSRTGLFRTEKLKQVLEPYLGGINFEDLKTPLMVVATDLESGEVVYLDSGSVIDAVVASSAIPGLFTPMKVNNRRLIDGGTVELLPIRALGYYNIDRILAVDCLGRMQPDLLTNIPAILMQAFYIIQRDRFNQLSHFADYILSLNTDEYSQFDFRKKDIQEIIDIGHREAEENIEEIIDALSREKPKTIGLGIPSMAPENPI